jgi:hypothetical protein
VGGNASCGSNYSGTKQIGGQWYCPWNNPYFTTVKNTDTRKMAGRQARDFGCFKEYSCAKGAMQQMGLKGEPVWMREPTQPGGAQTGGQAANVPAANSTTTAGAPITPPVCTGNFILENGACRDCGANMVANRTTNPHRCDCPATKEWNASQNQCLCPEGTEDKNGTCEALPYTLSEERGGQGGSPFDIDCGLNNYIQSVTLSYDDKPNVIKGIKATCRDGNKFGRAGTFQYKGYDWNDFETKSYTSDIGFDKAKVVTSTDYKDADKGGTVENAVRALGFGAPNQGEVKMFGSSADYKSEYGNKWDKDMGCANWNKAGPGKKYVINRIYGKAGNNIDRVAVGCALVNA